MNRTASLIALLALVFAGVVGAGPAAWAQTVPTVSMDGKTQPVTRTAPQGVDLTGSYEYIDEPGEALVVLRADGSGDWRGDTGEATRPITWWLAADSAGKALSEEAPNGTAHILIVNFGGEDYSGYELAIAKNPRIVVINRDRAKPY